LIQAFRDGIDALALDAPQAEALAQEARLGFTLHIELFQQLSQTGGAQKDQTVEPKRDFQGS
jgi:heme oxygenase